MIKFTSKEAENPRLKQIDEAALRLLYKLGIRKMAVEDICREASVSKATFYKFYDNKLDIVLHLFRGVLEKSYAEYRAVMDQEIPFDEKVAQMIRLKMEYAGNMSQEFIEDIVANGGPEVNRMLQEETMKAVGMLFEDFSAAQKKGLIRRDLNLQFMVYFINHMSEMLKDPGFSSIFPNPPEMIRELVNFFFYGIMPRSKHHDEQK